MHHIDIHPPLIVVQCGSAELLSWLETKDL